MLGPGKYGEAATQARLATGAKGVILIVFEGNKGHGFTAAIPEDIIDSIAPALRDVADSIERDRLHRN